MLATVSEPDLFVVCKNCSSEVSPYVTECPYCGQRVRKRAPRLDREGERPEPPARETKAPRLPRLRRGEIAGIAPETRPYATGVLILLSALVSLLLEIPSVPLAEDAVLLGPPGDEWWRYLTSPFVHPNLGYQFIALFGVAIFGMHLERRFGPLTLVLTFLACAAAGSAAAVGAAAAGLGGYPVMGANGAALGLLCAWLAEDRRALERGDDRGNDLLGVYVFAAVLALMFLADPSASPAAAAGGALAGTIVGLLLSLRR
ncbi:MAG: rhomboid family intramembrane serine protease [Thermoleophilaceae bacterium]|jgi:membrane associated rhomboid family serine protease|nr:rhomboid family intramembrane serine protease [Thermoleophilaceae bacterium]